LKSPTENECQTVIDVQGREDQTPDTIARDSSFCYKGDEMGLLLDHENPSVFTLSRAESGAFFECLSGVLSVKLRNCKIVFSAGE
jgi:hypothetical protein